MASSIVTSTAKQLGGLIVKEAKYLYEVSDKIERLQHDLEWMLCFLEDADNRQNREKVVAKWISTIREFTYEAEEIIESYIHKVSNPRKDGGLDTTIKWWLCALNDARALHQVGSNIDDLRGRIGELVSRLQLYGVKVSKEEERKRNRSQTYSHVEEDPIGLEDHIKQVVEQLVTNEQVKVVGIWGMGGLGKTTLARKVLQDTSVREHFNGGSTVWVCISKQFDTRNVFMEILMGLADADDENRREKISKLTDGELPREICEVLRLRECLVVLDDLWECHDWDALKPAFESIKSSGSKILITTRNKGLTEHIDPLGYSHNPNLLSDDDSWKLLQRIAFAETDNPDGDMKAKEELGREMLRHCKGLPLAISTLGGVLCSKKTLAEWKNVQNNIKSYLMGDSTQTSSNDNGLFAVLELSYSDLPYYLKPCFMYLGHFPEDYEISADRLYHLWEAEGLVTNSEDDDDVEDLCLDDIAKSYLNELVERCLVQVAERCKVNGRIKTCGLHDLVRLMCIKKCKEVNFLKTISTKVSSSKKKSLSSSSKNMKLHRCALYLDDSRDMNLPVFEPSADNAPCIRSLLVFQDKKGYWGGDFLTENMKKSLLLLRVLDLEGATIAKYGMSMKDLIHLRYLSFNRAIVAHIPGLRVFWDPKSIYISELPHFWDCKYIETLDLRCSAEWNCSIKISNKFWRLQRLRNLYLPECFQLLGRKKIVALTENQLEQLETLINFSLIYFDIKSLWKMTSMRAFTFSKYNYCLTREKVGHFVKLPMIATRWQSRYPIPIFLDADVMNGDPSLLITLVSHACISELKIQGRIEDASRLERFDESCLTRLELSGTEIGQQGISVIEKLPVLAVFILEGSFADKKISFSGGGFPLLSTLQMSNLRDLEEWEIGEGAVPNLRDLAIVHCEKLKNIPSNLSTTVRIRRSFPSALQSRLRALRSGQ